LVDVIDSIRPGQAVLLDYQVIPDVDPVSEIPYWKEQDEKQKSNRFLKRGPQIDVMKRRSLDDAMESAVRPWQDRNRRFSEINPNMPYSGYGWWGSRIRQHKKVHLCDCIEGAKIFAFSMLNQNDEDNTITMREYNDSERTSMGGDYLFEVPSADVDTDESKKYDVSLSSVPVTRLKDKHARVLDLHSKQTCKATTKRVTKRYSGREHYWCKHAVAAYLHLAKQESDKGNNTPIEMCPFALPSQKTVDFYNKLTYRVMIQEEKIGEDGKKRRSKRHLNKAEKEILLWGFVAKYGPRNTFFAKGKLQDYKWQRIYEPAGK
jgi:hypothetical protein